MKYGVGEIGKVIGGSTPSIRHKEYYISSGKGIARLVHKDLSSYSKMCIDHGSRDLTSGGYNNSSARLLPKDSVLINSKAPIEYVAIAKNETATNQGLKSIVPDKSKVYSEYLYYLMLGSKLNLEGVAFGLAFKEVSGKVMEESEVEIPSLLEREKILNQLIPIQRKIELDDQINDNLAT